MNIIEVASKNEIEVFIELVSDKDFKQIRDGKKYSFDWTRYKGKEVYKLQPLNEDSIKGLMCILDHTDEATNAIEIELLEVEKDSVGKKKKLDRIAGCLIAFACRESIKRGHEGFIFLTPKSELVDHYRSKYYLQYLGPMGRNPVGVVTSDDKIARKLINEYLQ
ncbi:MAG TPA: hypothetical protein VK498_05060 [Ferruginibacter sp.]|nr:hypothetical protein [Ferruginibacter sp.]